jgi:hypothetical protein
VRYAPTPRLSLFGSVERLKASLMPRMGSLLVVVVVVFWGAGRRASGGGPA